MNFKTLAVLFLSSVQLQGVTADSGFANSCHDWSVVPWKDYNKSGTLPPGHVIFSATCKEAGEGAAWNVNNGINLNACIANANGRLQGQPGGGFSGSCWEYSTSGSVLHCKCRNNAGNTVDASLDLNNIIGNYGGRMKCYGTDGW